MLFIVSPICASRHVDKGKILHTIQRKKAGGSKNHQPCRLRQI